MFDQMVKKLITNVNERKIRINQIDPVKKQKR